MLLLLFKFIAGFVGHSAAMMADAIHSLSDFLTDIVVLLFVRISGKPQDKSHDYGHAKYETLAMTLIGVALLLVAVGIVYHGVVAIAFWAKGGQLAAPGMLALWAAMLSIILKEGVYRVLKDGDGSSPTTSWANAGIFDPEEEPLELPLIESR